MNEETFKSGDRVIRRLGGQSGVITERSPGGWLKVNWDNKDAMKHVANYWDDCELLPLPKEENK